MARIATATMISISVKPRARASVPVSASSRSPLPPLPVPCRRCRRRRAAVVAGGRAELDRLIDLARVGVVGDQRRRSCGVAPLVPDHLDGDAADALLEHVLDDAELRRQRAGAGGERIAAPLPLVRAVERGRRLRLAVVLPPCSVCCACCALVSTVCSCSADGSSTLSTMIVPGEAREALVVEGRRSASFSNSPKPLSYSSSSNSTILLAREEGRGGHQLGVVLRLDVARHARRSARSARPTGSPSRSSSRAA